MIELVAAAQIASIIGNSVAVIDKIYTRFFEVKTGKEPEPGLRLEHSGMLANNAQERTIVSTYHGGVVQIVTYDQLAKVLNKSDFDYIKARERALENHKYVWEEAYPELALKIDDIDRAKLRAKLKRQTDEVGNELKAILDFLEKRCGVKLDDHYEAFRDLAATP